jgi:potassium-dependent mechanosensitive channel
MLKIPIYKIFSYLFLLSSLLISINAAPLKVTPILDQEIYSLEKLTIEIDRFTSIAEKDPQAALALKYYRQAKNYVEKNNFFQNNEKDYKNSIETNPVKEKRLQEKKKKLSQDQSELLKRFNLEKSEIELNRIYTQQKALIAELRQQRLALMEKISAAKLQPEKITRNQDEIFKRQEIIRIKLNDSSVAEANKDVFQANQLALQLEQTSLLAQLNMLEAQRLGLPSYLSLLETELTLIIQTITLEEKIEQQMLQQLEIQRQKTQDNIENETFRLSSKIIADFPLLQSVLETNLLLNDEHKRLIQDFSKTNQLFVLENKRRELLERNLQRLNQQLAIDAPDSLMGEFLYQQREELVLIIGASRDKKETKLRALQLGQARLSQFKVDDKLLSFNEKKENITQLLKQLDNNKQWLTLSDKQQKVLLSEFTTLVEQRVTLLKRLREQYINYIKLINDLIHEEQQVDEKSRLYTKILDEHLWLLPSNKLMDYSSFDTVLKQSQWFYTWSHWKRVIIDLFSSAYDRLAKSIISLFIIFVLFLVRPYLKQQIKHISTHVNKVIKDSYWRTIKTFFITLLLSLPWVLLIYVCGHLLSKESSGFSNAVGIALVNISKYVFMLELIRYIMMEKGLAETHFRWKTSLCLIMHYKLLWFMPLSALGWFGVTLTQSYFDTEIINLSELGRFYFLLLLVIFFVFLINSHSAFKNNPYSLKHKKTFFSFCYLILFILSSLMVGTILGYYFTSVRILDLLTGAFFIVFFLFIAYYLALRWLTLIQARLSYQQMLDKQSLENDLKTSSELQNKSENEITDEFQDELDIQQIKTQIRRILNWILIMSILVALAWHFREVSSVFNTLDNINLWKYNIDGQPTGLISLWDVFMSLIAILLTIVATRNLPGLIELSVFNPLDVDADIRYAASRIVQYIIVMIGFVVSVSWLGLSWTDVQWLVTAMSVGLGFGLKEIFSNFFSGLILLFERPIRIGDVVTIGQVSGTVSKIQTRATTIIDWDKKELIIPNQSLILENLVNWTLSNQTTRVTFMLGLAYDTDVEHAQQIIMETIVKHPLVLKEPEPSALLINFGDSSLDFEIRVFVAETNHRMKTKHELHINLVNAMRKNNIQIPFPQRDIHINGSQ